MSVKIINGIKAIKEGDTLTDIKLLVTDGVGLAVDFSSATSVKFVLGNASGKILEKTAPLGTNRGELIFGLDPGEVTGYGRMFLEIHVTKSGQKQIYPEGSYLVFDIVKNLNALGTVVSTVTIEQFELRIANKEQAVTDALASLATSRATYDARFAVYEAQYNSMVTLAANVNGALGNMTNAANEQVMKAALGAEISHLFTETLSGKVMGSVVENPHVIRRGAPTTMINPVTSPQSLIEYTNQQQYNDVMTQNNVSTASGGNSTVSGAIGMHLIIIDMIEAVQRKYNIVLNGTTADKVAWLKQNISRFTFSAWAFGSSTSGNKAYLTRWNANGSYWDVANGTNSTGNVARLNTGGSSNYGIYIDATGKANFLVYTDASNGTISSTVQLDYVSIDITIKSVLALEEQTAVEYRINVLNPPKRTGLLPYVVGGDITVNTQRLQAMLAYLNTKGYGNLYFPNLGIDGIGSGRFYQINDTLKMEYTVDWAIPITIEGEDYGSYINMTDDTKPVFWINGVNNVRDFRIKNITTKGGSYGIRIRWGAYVYIEDVNIRGCKTACMRFENTFGFCSNVWMFHTSSRLVEATGNGHIRWNACTFGEDAGGFYLEDTEMSFNNCKFLQLKTFDVAPTETGIGGGDGVTGTKTKAIFYTLFNVNMWFTDCDFIHNETQSYLFYFVNSPAVYQFVNCKWDVGVGTSLFAFRNPSVYQFKTGLMLNSCEIVGVCELYSFALSDAIRNLTIVNSTLPEATMIENDPNSAQLYQIGAGCTWT